MLGWYLTTRTQSFSPNGALSIERRDAMFNVAVHPTTSTSDAASANHIRSKYQVVSQQPQVKHSQRVTVNCFLPLESLTAGFARFRCGFGARLVKVACPAMITQLVRQFQPLLQCPHCTIHTLVHSELRRCFTQPSSAGTLIFVRKVQLSPLRFT